MSPWPAPPRFGGDPYYPFLTWAAAHLPAGSTIIEAGTCSGAGARCLAVHGHPVHTYDIKNRITETLQPNVTFHLESCHDISADLLLSAALIFLDIDPHDGDAEILFYDRLCSIGYTGLLLCDDVDFQPMQKFWDHVTHPKHNYGPEIGRGSGLGLINLNG